MDQVQSQGGLAHAGHPGDSRDDDGRASPSPALLHHCPQPGQLSLPAAELGDIGWELMGDDLGRGPQDIGLAARAVLAVHLLLGSLVEVHQCPGGDAELALVGLDNLKRGETVAPFVLDQGAVGTEQLPGECAQRHAPLGSDLAEGGTETGLRPHRAAGRFLFLVQ